MMLPKLGKNLLVAILIGGSALQSVPLTAANQTAQTPVGLITDTLKRLQKSPLKKSLVGAALFAFIVFRCKEPSNADARTSWPEIKELVTNPTKLAQGLKTDRKATLAKFWYMVSDLMIGRPGEFAYFKGDLKDKSVSLKGPFKPLGWGGAIHALTVPLEPAIHYSVAALLLASGKLEEFLNVWGWGPLLAVNAKAN